MKLNILNTKKKSGFAVFTVLVIIIALIGIVSYYSISGGEIDTGSYVKKSMSRTLGNQAVILKSGWNNARASGLLPYQITMNADPNTGLFAPLIGGLHIGEIPPSVMENVTDKGLWVLRKYNTGVSGVGTSSDDVVVFMAFYSPNDTTAFKTTDGTGVNRIICEEYNKNQINTTAIDTQTFSWADLVGSATPSNPETSSSDVSLLISGSNVSGKETGCVQLAGTNNYTIYVVLEGR